MQVTGHSPLRGNIDPDALNNNRNLRQKNILRILTECLISNVTLSLYKKM